MTPLPRRVAFVASKLAFGGAERVLVEQVHAVADLGVPVDVWVAKDDQFEQLAPGGEGEHRPGRVLEGGVGVDQVRRRLGLPRADVSLAPLHTARRRA